MTYDVFMAGFGGQGVLLIGNLLAYAALLEGKNASYFPAYGVEKRGGAATCTVVVSDGEVGSPVIGRPGAALLLNQLSMEKYFDRVRSGGFCLINTSLVETSLGARDDIEILRLPLNEMALELGDLRLLNMITIGAYAERTGADTCAYHGVTVDAGPIRHGATRGCGLYFFDPAGNRNEIYTGGYWFDPDDEPTTWTEDEMGRAIFYYRGQVDRSFMTVHS